MTSYVIYLMIFYTRSTRSSMAHGLLWPALSWALIHSAHMRLLQPNEAAAGCLRHPIEQLQLHLRHARDD